MDQLSQYAVPYLVSQAVSIIILVTAIRNTRKARGWFFILFLYAACYNFYIGLANPDEYLGFADLAIPLYRDFINGTFGQIHHIMIPLIAAGQLMIAIGMIARGRWVKAACYGAIIFLIAIAPLGVGSAFPFSITVSAAAVLILRNDSLEQWFRVP